MTTVNLDSVTTTDAVPTTTPHRISALAGENTAVALVTVAGAGAGKVRAVRATTGATRATGTKVAGLGCVCNLDRCGAPGVMPLGAAVGTQFNLNVTYQELPAGADRNVTINVFGLREGEAWV